MCSVFDKLYVRVAHACVCLCMRARPHVCMCAGCADLMTLDTMTPQERKRQGYIHELIQTEETYVEDLELVLDVRTNTHKHTVETYFEIMDLFPEF